MDGREDQIVNLLCSVQQRTGFFCLSKVGGIPESEALARAGQWKQISASNVD